MKTERIQNLTETFEGHAQQTESGIEYWLARDLQHLLGYSKWDNFVSVISKARTACEISGHKAPDHFADVGKTIQMPKGATKEVPDSLPLADFAPTIILKAKDFATEITLFNAREHGMKSETAISQEHVTNNQAVRNTKQCMGSSSRKCTSRNMV
jgi:hypothetical protein